VQHVVVSRSLVFCPGERASDHDVFGEENVVPRGGVVLCRLPSVYCLVLGAECLGRWA